MSAYKKIEFLRFGARRGGNNIGCCAVDLIQNFKGHPDDKAIDKMYRGDNLSSSVVDGDGNPLFLGPTNRDIFLNRLRVSTFDKRDMPNRIFLVALNKSQTESESGKAWLAILKENGFEFIRATSNSVYSGVAINPDPDVPAKSQSPVYLFGLFRNIGEQRIEDPFAPPKSWSDLPEPTKTDHERWVEGETTFYEPTDEELVEFEKNEKQRLDIVRANIPESSVGNAKSTTQISPPADGATMVVPATPAG